MGVKVRKPKGHTSWCVVIDHEGRRKTTAVGSREAAERVKREIEARLALGGMQTVEAQKPSLPTLADYAQGWLKNVGLERKPSTAGFYSQYLRLYVLPRFSEYRLDNIERDDVKRLISDLRTRGLAKNTIRLAVTTLRAVLNAADVPAGRIYSVADMFTDPQYIARQMIQRFPWQDGREIALPNVTPKLSETPGETRWLGPQLGEHTDGVLQSLGYDPDEIARLRANKAI